MSPKRTITETGSNPTIDAMFKAGVQYGFSKSRRHPSFTSLIFGVKNKVEIIDLEKANDYLVKAKEFVKKLASEKKTILFVGGKNEVKDAVRKAAQRIDMPFVSGRWIGGTLTNFTEIKKRITKFEELSSAKEKGELEKYTKKERLLIDREIEHLNTLFEGIVKLQGLPDAILIIDAKYEDNALAEAKQKHVPILSICGTDNDIKAIDYPIPGNDSSVSSIAFFLDEIVKAYQDGNNHGTN